VLALALGCSSQADTSYAQLSAPSGNLKIFGPFVHEHLALYIVEDPSAKSAGDFITLAEGLASGDVKVSEQQNAQVHELLIENSSGKPCFVQAGDVVKGGQQDRTLAQDFVIPPHTPPSPIASFCVEQSRWHGKGQFESSTQNAYGKDLKLAVQQQKDQGAVWAQVAGNKKRLVDNNGLSAPKSSSLNEELDNSRIQERLKAFKESLAKIVEGRPQAVGLIAAVNGRFTTADVYADPGLFRKLFLRLLESASLEALSLKTESNPAPAGKEAATFLGEAEKGKTTNEKIREGLEANTTDNPKSVQFDYRWQNESLHRQTLSK
jgi:hypothetical protein